MNPQVHQIEGEERKIHKSNNMIMQPHHSLMKVYIITTPLKCSTLYVPVFITHYLCVIMVRVNERKEIRRRGKVAMYIIGM